jgi:exopolyphosphatase/pppGpp-phosphohydrolase
VDFFDRHQHTADIILETEMNGFSHRQIALTSAIVRVAGDERSEPERYVPLLDATDWAAVERAAVLLTLADDIEERCPPGGLLDFDCRIEAREVVLSVPDLGGWRPRGVGASFERAFGKALLVRPGAA